MLRVCGAGMMGRGCTSASIWAKAFASSALKRQICVFIALRMSSFTWRGDVGWEWRCEWRCEWVGMEVGSVVVHLVALVGLLAEDHLNDRLVGGVGLEPFGHVGAT